MFSLAQDFEVFIIYWMDPTASHPTPPTSSLLIVQFALHCQRKVKQVLGRVNAKGTTGPYTSTAICKVKVHGNILSC